MKTDDKFVCSIEPVNGVYHWLLESKGATYGGHAKTQKEAMDEAFKILNPRETIFALMDKINKGAADLKRLIDEPLI